MDKDIVFRWFLPLNVPSSKNGKEIKVRGIKKSKATNFNPDPKGRGKMVVHVQDSDNVKKFIADSMQFWLDNAKDFRRAVKDVEGPVLVWFRFVRPSHVKFDFVNPIETLLDCMSGKKYSKTRTKTKFNNFEDIIRWIKDDDYVNICPIICPEVTVDRENAGVEIRIANKFVTYFPDGSSYQYPTGD